MSRSNTSFNLLARVLHWLMAILLLAMLFIGIGMVSTTSPRYSQLLSVHRSIGITILLLVAIRLINRLLRPPPPLPSDLPAWQRVAAVASHWFLYGLMIVLPLVGWSMLSAGGYPTVVFGDVHLPPILPHDVHVYAALRWAHTVLAFALFGIFLLHLGAALFHALIRQDDVLPSMTMGVAPARSTNTH
jgi:cytochrome b561